MWPFRKEMTEIEAIDRELDRLHRILGMGSKTANGEFWLRIKELEATLIEVTRKNNGLEY